MPVHLSTALVEITLADGALSAAYVPIADGSRLIYLNDSHELITVIEADLVGNLGNDVHLLRDVEQTIQTPFTKMLIDVKRTELLTGLTGAAASYGKYLSKYVNSSKVAEEMFLNVPSHVLPPVDKICGQFLDALLGTDDSEDHDEKRKSVIRDSWLPQQSLAEELDSDYSSQATSC